MDQFPHYLLRQLPELSADELAEFTAAFTLQAGHYPDGS